MCTSLYSRVCVKQGECVVSRLDNETNESVVIGSLKAGDYFGEAALINRSERGATVTAHGAIRTYYLNRNAFFVLFSEDRLNVQVSPALCIMFCLLLLLLTCRFCFSLPSVMLSVPKRSPAHDPCHSAHPLWHP